MASDSLTETAEREPDHIERGEGDSCSCGWKSHTKAWRAHAAIMRKRGQTTAERGAFRTPVERVADRLAAVAYNYAVAMHESIEAGRGAVGWRDAELVESILSALRSERRAGREAMREEAAKAAESAYPCSCDEAYRVRGLTAPDCFRCVPLDEAAAMIRALPLDLA